MKKLIFLTIDIFIVYLIFVGIDAYRIKSSPFEDIKPLITIDEERTDTEIIYVGLGYTVEYYLNKDGSIYGADFTLFNKIMIWGYVT